MSKFGRISWNTYRSVLITFFLNFHRWNLPLRSLALRQVHRNMEHGETVFIFLPEIKISANCLHCRHSLSFPANCLYCRQYQAWNVKIWFCFAYNCMYRTGSATLLRVAISSVETRKSRDFLWWKLRGISEEVTRVQRVAWKTSVEILATSVWSSV